MEKEIKDLKEKINELINEFAKDKKFLVMDISCNTSNGTGSGYSTYTVINIRY